MLAVEIAFWASVALLIHTHVGYPLTLWLLARLRGGGGEGRSREAGTAGGNGAAGEPPFVSLIVAAHDEERVIERKVRNALELDYPRWRLELIVASDGSTDRTVELARAAGANLVLDLPRAGKIAIQNAAVERARGELLAFSDANCFWAPGALRRLVAPFADPGVGYVCGQVRFSARGAATPRRSGKATEGGRAGEAPIAAPPAGTEEGLYWRYETAVRGLESELGGVTAGNGAIYAARREAYIVLGPSRSHDLSFPFEMVKRGWRALYAPAALAEERMMPTLEGEFARKRRMMRGLWDIVISDGMLSPRGYGPLYAYEIYSHRVLRYASPFLHLVALGTNLVLLGQGVVYTVTLAAQLALLVAAALGPVVRVQPFRVAYYYLLVTASIAAGLWDRLRRGEPAAWEKAEGTR